MESRLRLGRKIRAMRRERGYSVSELARRAKISRNYIAILEGRRPSKVTLETLEKIAEALGVTISDLLS